MGAAKVSIINDKQTRQAAMQHLLQDVQALEKMLNEDLFETDVQRIGAEQELEEYARKISPSIRQDGIRLVLQGRTTLEEVMRVTREN